MDATKKYDRTTCAGCCKQRDIPWSRLCGYCLAVALGRALRLIQK